MERLTEKGRRIRIVGTNINMPTEAIKIEARRYNKLAELEDIMEKYEINSLQGLEAILKDYDDMAKDVVEMALGVKVEVKN